MFVGWLEAGDPGGVCGLEAPGLFVCGLAAGAVCLWAGLRLETAGGVCLWAYFSGLTDDGPPPLLCAG